MAWPPQLLQTAAWYSRRPDGARRSAPASPQHGRWDSAADRWSGPCWRRTPAHRTRTRTTRRSRGKSSVRSWNTLLTSLSTGVRRTRVACAGVAGADRSRGWTGGRWLCAERYAGVKVDCAAQVAGAPAAARRPHGGVARGNRMSARRRRESHVDPPTLPTVLLLVALGAAACHPGAPPPARRRRPSPVAPSPRPSPSIEGDRPSHRGRRDRPPLRRVGGFIPPEWLAGRLPYFTLYGDGRVVFQQTTAEVPPREDNVSVGPPLRTAMLTEEQVQGLLETALRDGGLAIGERTTRTRSWQTSRRPCSRSTRANDSKTVSVVGLGMEDSPDLTP